jgi:hypothetical protein
MNLLTENKKIVASIKPIILENLKLAKQYADKGELSKEDLKLLINSDPTPQKKFVGWMAKMFIKNSADIDALRNSIEEFNVFLNKGKTQIKDINAFKTFKDLESELDRINQSGEGVSSSDLENDYEVVLDNKDLYIAIPHTHEASRKLGISKFAYRDCKDSEGNTAGKDSAWCTTYKAPDHFNDYYYNENVTFYYIRIKSQAMMDKINQNKVFTEPKEKYVVVAFAVLEDGRIDAYDGLDKRLTTQMIKEYRSIIGL